MINSEGNLDSRMIARAFEARRFALSSLAYRDEAAYRRYDGHGWLDAHLSPFGTDAHNLRGSKAARRMERTAQVMPMPWNSHTRSRLGHILEVESYARIVCRVLGLNVELAVAIALGHDLGHAPFGHRFESWAKKTQRLEFTHEAFAVFLLQWVERQGRGLNLTHQVLTGILHHGLSAPLENHESQESLVVRVVDKFAYLTADASDALHGRYGFEVSAETHPRLLRILGQLGTNQRDWATVLLLGLCQESAEAGRVSFEKSKEAGLMRELRDETYQIYPQVASGIGGMQLDAVYRGLDRCGFKCHPALVLAMLDDAATSDLYRLVRRYRRFKREDVTRHSVGDVIETLEEISADEFVRALAEPDLAW